MASEERKSVGNGRKTRDGRKRRKLEEKKRVRWRGKGI